MPAPDQNYEPELPPLPVDPAWRSRSVVNPLAGGRTEPRPRPVCAPPATPEIPEPPKIPEPTVLPVGSSSGDAPGAGVAPPPPGPSPTCAEPVPPVPPVSLLPPRRRRVSSGPRRRRIGTPGERRTAIYLRVNHEDCAWFAQERERTGLSGWGLFRDMRTAYEAHVGSKGACNHDVPGQPDLPFVSVANPDQELEVPRSPDHHAPSAARVSGRSERDRSSTIDLWCAGSEALP